MKDDVLYEGPSRKFGVLVVDDAEAVLDVLDYGLKQRGFGVWRAIDGRGALRTYGRYHEQIDIVLLDRKDLPAAGELQSARAQLRGSIQAVARVPLPMSVEPAAHFKA